MESTVSREDLIAKGIAFLKHPETQNNTLSNKISFLEKSGLGNEDISEVLKRSGASSDSFNIGAWLISTGLPATAILATGLLAYYLTGEDEPDSEKEQWTNAEDVQLIPGAGLSEDQYSPQTDRDNTMGQLDRSLSLSDIAETLGRQTEVLERAVERANDRLTSQEEQPAWAKELLKITTRLSTEVAAVRTLLEDKTASSEGSKSSVTRAQEGDDKEGTPINTDEATKSTNKAVAQPQLSSADHIARVRAAIKFISLAAANSGASTVFQQGCGALLLYIGKVFENPSVPRYRKVAVGNASFKSLVVPLKGYEKLFAAVGFAKRGAYFEWIWGHGESHTSSINATASKLATGTDTTKKEDGEEDVAECSSDEIRSAVLCECIALLRIGKDQGPSALLSELSEREKKAAEAAAVDSGKSSKDGDDGSERPSIAISDAPANITSLHPVHTDSAMNDPTANTATAVSDNVEQSEIEATAASNKSTVTLTGADSSIAAKMSVSEQNNNAMGAKTNRSATAGGKAAATSSVVSFDQIMKIAAAKTTNSTNNRDNDKVKKPEISSAATAATDPGNADDIGESKSEKTTETTITQAGNSEGR